MPPTRRAAKRSARTSRSYKETSSSEDTDSEDSHLSHKRIRPSAATSPVTPPSHKYPTRSQKDVGVLDDPSASSHSSSTKSKIPPKEKGGAQSVIAQRQVLSSGVIPPWTSLPYEILLAVFRYASYPLRDENQMPTASIGWLLKSARLCKAFAAPSLAALYECPPLFTPERSIRLVELLRENDDTHFITYKPKIKSLELDSRLALASTANSRSVFDVSMLIPLLPRLSAIDITNENDRPPFRRIGPKGKWIYRSSLFDALQNSETRLQGWRWHGDMLTEDLGALSDIHAKSCFQNIRRLSLSHLFLLSDGAIPTRRQKTALSADILTSLSQLSELCLESCQSDTWDVLNYLPRLLTTFEVINCSTFDNDTLLAFLVDKGTELEHLVMNHNRSLSLEFSSQLKACCPKLETFYMDLTYYSASVMGAISHRPDSEPSFDCLLQPGDVPMWPTKLQELSLHNLRKWTSEAATMFFESLVLSAPELPHLRSVSIKVILNISWRERAGFREKWISKLNEALLREKGGMCDRVEISIDNIRPSELRFKEEDFMDSEVSGDEDWTGGDEAEEADRYAW